MSDISQQEADFLIQTDKVCLDKLSDAHANVHRFDSTGSGRYYPP